MTATPYDAYRYAKGEAIKHPLGFDMKLREPLDFYAVTDHGFYMGMIENYADTSSEMSKNEWTKPMHNLNRPENVTVDSLGARADLFSSVLTQAIVKPYPYWHPKVWKAWFTNNIQVALQSFDYDVHKSAWADVANAAEEFNKPGEFTRSLAMNLQLQQMLRVATCTEMLFLILQMLPLDLGQELIP